MAKLVFSMIISHSMATWRTQQASSTGLSQTSRYTSSSTTSSDQLGTYLYGRRMYEVMVAWETLDGLGDQPPFIKDFAKIWRAASKIVYSSTLDAVSRARTRIERDFDPAAIRRMKEEAVGDIAVGGPGLAAQAISAGLVDEYQLFVAPIMVGGGTRSLPDAVRLNLDLVDTPLRQRHGVSELSLCHLTTRYFCGPHRGPANKGIERTASALD